MLVLDPSDNLELSFALKKAVKLSGLSLAEIVERLKQEYGVEITISALSHNINRHSTTAGFADIGGLWGE